MRQCSTEYFKYSKFIPQVFQLDGYVKNVFRVNVFQSNEIVWISICLEIDFSLTIIMSYHIQVRRLI